MALPALVVVSGPPGSGKTTLAHELARAIPCPAICRDEIKEGMVHAAGHFDAAPGDELTQRTFPLFFALIRTLLEHGVSVVAEAAFQDQLWRPNLEPLRELADLVIVQCQSDTETIGRRLEQRDPRSAHADAFAVKSDDFRRVTMNAPEISVDTTADYEPPVEQLVAFINHR